VEQLELNDKQRLADDDTIKDVQQSSAKILITKEAEKKQLKLMIKINKLM